MAVVGFTAALSPVQAQYTILHHFTGGTNDGDSPKGDPTAPAYPGNVKLYGMTQYGGVSNLGVIFEINIDGSGYTNLHQFTGGADGKYPVGSLLDTGELYGMTPYGGTYNLGTLFRIDESGYNYKIQHSFDNVGQYGFPPVDDGKNPKGSVVMDESGIYYGMTCYGGATNAGAVFQFQEPKTYDLIASFRFDNNAANPNGSLLLSGTTLYGMSQSGGDYDRGAVFKVNTDGHSFIVLHSFRGGYYDGYGPLGSLVIQGSMQYGMTEQGGVSNTGVIFKMNTDGSGYTNLHSFAGGTNDGAVPRGSLTLISGNLYGMTYAGGAFGKGTIFKVNTSGGGYTILHNFADGSDDGARPYGSLTLNGRTLYGMTSQGGASGNGVIFLLPVDPVITSASPLPLGVVGAPYSTSLAATGGTTPYNWQITSGVLPAALSLSNSTGVISGTPTNSGTTIFSVRCTDNDSLYTNKTFSLTISSQPFTYVTNNNTITITGYIGSGGAVTITNTINGLPVTGIGDSVFAWCASLTSITIPASVTNIGNGAFYPCTNLTAITVHTNNPAYSSVGGVLFNKSQTTILAYPGGIAGSYTISNSVTSIGYAAFGWCRLTSITIPNSVTSIGTEAFGGCRSLTSITIPNSVTYIGDYTFPACTSLTSVTIGTGVTSLSASMFSGCSSLTRITISASVTNLGDGAFWHCTGLSNVFFFGNAPTLGSGTVFTSDPATVYYLPGTTGWYTPFGGLTAVCWNPQARNLGVQTNQFRFTITGSSNLTIVVEACTNLVNAVWSPVGTNTLTGGSSPFSDPQWTNYPSRFYRFRAP